MKKLVVTMMVFNWLCSQAMQAQTLIKTPLMDAAYYYNVNKVIELINDPKAPANIHAKDAQGHTALDWYYAGGAQLGHPTDSFMITLLTLGKDAHLTPLMKAAYGYNTNEMLSILNEQKANMYDKNAKGLVAPINQEKGNIHDRDANGHDALWWYYKGGADLGHPTDSFVITLLTPGQYANLTPLMEAAYYYNVNKMVSLINDPKNPADIHAKDAQGHTALNWYYAGGAQLGHPTDSFVITLLTSGNLTPLMEAAYHYNVAKIVSLINDPKNPADIHAKDAQGHTALDWWNTAAKKTIVAEAFLGGDSFVIRLLTSGKEANLTPLMEAAYFYNVNKMVSLINDPKNPADIHAKDAQGHTALDWYYKGRVEHGNPTNPFVITLLTSGKMRN